MVSRVIAGSLAGLLAFAQVPPPTMPSPIIKTTSRLVNVNVVAFDKKGNPVRDLTREDFVLTDNGAARPISLFSLETTDGARPIDAAAAKSAPGIFTNRVEQSASAVTIFLLDGLNTEMPDQAFAKSDLLKYLKEVLPNDRVALFALNRELLLVHDFTTDIQALLDAVQRQRPRINQEVKESEPMASTYPDPVVRFMLNNTNQKMADFTIEVRATETAAALEAIAAHAARVPGRKNLVWISGGFPMALGFGKRGSRDRRSFTSEEDRAIRALNDADIAVYPVDARRLETQSVSDVTGGLATPLSKRGQTQAIAQAAKEDPNFQSMEELAAGTGGRPFHNINDLGAAIKTAINDARVSYALAFSPAADAIDGKYHTIKLQVNRPGVQVRYREGYVAYPDPPQVSLAQAIASPAEFTGVGITVNLKPAPGGVYATFNFDAKDLSIEKRGDNYAVTLEMMMITGKIPARPKATPITLTITADTRERVMREGLMMGMNLKAPPGPVSYHVGVRDMLSGAIGTLHLSKN